MLDIKALRQEPDIFKASLAKKNVSPEKIDVLLEKDKEWREENNEVNRLKSVLNSNSKEIGRRKKNGEDAADLLSEMKKLSAEIKEREKTIRGLEDEIHSVLIAIPNTPSDTAPVGSDESFNVVVKTVGNKPEYSFKPLDHLELAEKLDILDFSRGGKISGSGFPVYKGAGARLERALINFFIDTHVEKNGFTEIFPPFLVNRDSMTGTGQLPKMENDMYYVESDDLYLIPTAEVPVTNLHRNEILSADKLPLKYVAYSACFRREAGSYGKDTRGFLRVHQFNKVEMVQFVRPEDSYQVLEKLVGYATALLDELGITYRIVELATGDLSFAAAKCYDLEVWAPGEEKWLEAASISNFEDFQARRANIRFRPEAGSRPEYVHTLNGSGLATSRVIVALLETYQNEDGSVRVPEALKPYMGKIEVIS
jgi:seryl-tRNA synthetase